MSKTSGATEGQDLIVHRILNQSKGSYLDIGAGHPIQDSNTYFFYKLGWQGIAIEPNPLFKSEWKALRPRDTLYNCALNRDKKVVNYYMHPTLWTLNSMTKLPTKSKDFEVDDEQITTLEIETVTPQQIKSGNKKFDLCSIDTEGGELEILKNLLESDFQIKILIVEVSGINLVEDLKENQIVKLCDVFHMKPIAKTLHDLIFINVLSGVERRFPKQMLM
jgi:FkbM family methyltransferase